MTDSAWLGFFEDSSFARDVMIVLTDSLYARSVWGLLSVSENSHPTCATPMPSSSSKRDKTSGSQQTELLECRNPYEAQLTKAKRERHPLCLVA